MQERDPDVTVWVIEQPGPTAMAWSGSLLAQVGLTTEDAITAAFQGQPGRFIKIWLRDWTDESDEVIGKLATAPDAEGKPVLNTYLQRAAIFAVLTEAWSEDLPITMETFRKLKEPIAKAIGEEITLCLSPNPLAHPDFMAAWRKASELRQSVQAVPDPEPEPRRKRAGVVHDGIGTLN